jgi:hypothetical protein
MSEHTDEPRRLEINWIQAAGGALAAVSSAVLLSTVGVAGTIIGAAIGSVIVTVGNSVYPYYLAASKERVAAAAVVAKEAARTRGRTRTGATSTTEMRMPADERDQADEEVREAEETATQGTNWREIFSKLNWKRIAVAAAGIFVLAMGAILTFELVSGHSVSSYTGGSSKDGPRTSFGGDAEPKQTEPTKPASTAPTESTEPTTATDATTSDPPESEPTQSNPTTTAPPEEEAPTTAPPTTAPPAEEPQDDAQAEADPGAGSGAEPGAEGEPRAEQPVE